MISLSSFLMGRSGTMENVLISLDTQIRLYLWTITEINAMRCAAELQHNSRIQKRVSHYKKRWRDRYIKPDSKPLISEDPLKSMNKLVNSIRTYDHIITFQHILSHIVEDDDTLHVQQIVDRNILKSIN